MTRYLCHKCETFSTPCEFDDHDMPCSARPLPKACAWSGDRAEWKIAAEPIGNPDPERDIRAIVREEIANSPRIPDADGIVAIVRGEIHRADLATRDAARRIAVGEINTAIKVARQVNVRGIE